MTNPTKILLLTTEPLPLPGLPTTGAGLRAWGLGFGLKSAGLTNVTMAFAADAVRGREVDTSAIPFVKVFERSRLREFIDAEAPDAVVLQHWGLANSLPPLKCPLAIDLAGPHLLERRLWGSKDPDGDLREKLAALARADYVVCSGEFQRHYFLPFLFQAGFDPLPNLCPVIPFSVSPDIPSPSPSRDTSRFLFSGFFLPWQDPKATIEWTLEALTAREKGKLVVVGGPHPSGDVSGGGHDALAKLVDAHPRVERHGIMPFERLLGLMLGCGAAIDLMPRNPERELAFPTRTVVFLWAGLPVIHNDYDELAEPIARAKAGWTLDPADKAGFQRLIERLAGHGEDVIKRGEKAQELVRANYTWDRTIEPLAAWCARPALRSGKRAPVVPSASIERPAPAERAPRRAERTVTTVVVPAEQPNRIQQLLAPLAFLAAIPLGAALFLVFGLAEILKRALSGGNRRRRR